MDTGKEISIETDSITILGTILSSIDGSEIPTENGQSNFGCEGSNYAYYEDGVIVKINNKWIFFEAERVYLGDATPQNGEVSQRTQSPQNLDDAVKWYLNEKEAHKYLEGEYFASSYIILDTIESSESVTLFTHILCEWISLDGETVSGGAGLTSITFKKNDNVYEYEKSTSYHIPDAPEIPQKVKDTIANPTYFTEMRSEVDKDIAEFLEAS